MAVLVAFQIRGPSVALEDGIGVIYVQIMANEAALHNTPAQLKILRNRWAVAILAQASPSYSPGLEFHTLISMAFIGVDGKDALLTDAEDLRPMKDTVLRETCRQRDLTMSGTKKELIGRLIDPKARTGGSVAF